MPQFIRFSPAVPQPITLFCEGDPVNEKQMTVPGTNQIQIGALGMGTWNQGEKLYDCNGFKAQFEGGNVLHIDRAGIVTTGEWKLP